MSFYKKNKEVNTDNQSLEQIFTQISIIRNDINKYENIVPCLEERVERLTQQNEMLKNCVLATRRETKYSDMATYYDAAKTQLKTTCLSLEQAYKELEKIAPKAYGIWRGLFAENEECYKGLPTNSCSVAGHLSAKRFAEFISIYMRGVILDIGCGPQSLPSYLVNYPVEYIVGADPLLPEEPHPFRFQQCICEFLPWADNSFDGIILATSLDHVLLLDKAMEEIKRVLRPNGYVYIWIGLINETKEYNPYTEDIEAYDKYHMFHMSKKGLEALMIDDYDLIDWIQDIAHNHYYVFQLKEKE